MNDDQLIYIHYMYINLMSQSANLNWYIGDMKHPKIQDGDRAL